ncbi:transglutaminase-like domain-containing protein [Myroides albus]|uniref:DUF3857 domain-containing protein n=1 Tax=Myroides albus TaxID=2562892 RepID=A0A6I3LC75_9FLAO|nr:transglutaminase-like domain-containing protein [Myroides albus]MTG97059.1 hypothetical protein [Myroides albus]UVD78518.1 transglutaminase-like domain-containing protein [Myroides albus]
MKKIFLISFLVLSTFSSIAQVSIDNVTKEELLEKQNRAFPTSGAVIVDEKNKVYFDINLRDGNFISGEEVTRKIKLYKERDLSKLSFTIPYFVRGAYAEDVTIDEVYVYSLVNNEITKTKITSFESKKEGDYREKGVDFTKIPNIPEGSIITYRYKKLSENLDVLPEWFIQGDLPKQRSIYTMRIPTYFTYQMIQTGSQKIASNESIIDVKYGNGLLDSNTIKTLEKTLVALNVPTFSEEVLVDNAANYINKVRFDLSSVQFPGSKQQQVLGTKQTFFENLQKNKRYWKEILNDRYYRKKISQLDLSAKSDLEKADLILNYLQKEVTWNGMYGIYPENGLKSTYLRGQGNTADINLMLISMLRYVGLDANPALVSTRSNGKKKEWQGMYYNNLIAVLQSEGSYYFLDASSKNASIGVIPIDNLNGVVTMFSDKEGTKDLISTPAFVSSRKENYQLEFKPNGSLTGTAIHAYDNYEAFFVKEKFSFMGRFKYIKELEFVNPGLSVHNFVLNDNRTVDKNIARISFGVNKPNGSFSFNNKFFVNLFQFYDGKSNPFVTDNRLYPIDFAFPNSYTYSVSLLIPKGYKVDVLPDDLEIKDVDSGVSAQVKYTRKNNRIEVMVGLLKSKAVIEPEYYENIKQVYNSFYNKLQEQITIEVELE